MTPPLLVRLLRVKPATRYPADPRAVFVLGLAVATGVPLLLARIAPGSVEELLPLWGVIAWGWSLVLGCLVTLGGMAKQSTTGIIIEQVGSVMVGFTTIIYGTCVAFVVGGAGGLAAAVFIGFGISCFYRWLQLQVLLNLNQTVVNAVRQGETVLPRTELQQDALDISRARARREEM